MTQFPVFVVTSWKCGEGAWFPHSAGLLCITDSWCKQCRVNITNMFHMFHMFHVSMNPNELCNEGPFFLKSEASALQYVFNSYCKTLLGDGLKLLSGVGGTR